MDDANITEWETRLAFLENNLDKLNDVVREQSDELFLLNKEIRYLRDKIRDLEQNEDDPESGPPPHY